MDNQKGEYQYVLPQDLLQLLFEAAVIYHENDSFGLTDEQPIISLTAKKLEDLFLINSQHFNSNNAPSVLDVLNNTLTIDLDLPEQDDCAPLRNPDLRFTQEELYLMLRQGEMEELAGQPITDPDQWVLERRKTHPLKPVDTPEVTIEMVEAALAEALSEQDTKEKHLKYLERPSVSPPRSEGFSQALYEARLKREESLNNTSPTSEPD